MFFRFRGAEYREGENWEMKQQLTPSYILILIKSGQGSLTIDHTTYRVRPNAVYICPSEHTFGLEADGIGAEELFLFRFDVYGEGERSARRLQWLKSEPYFLQGEVAVFPTGSLVAPCEEILDYLGCADALERFRVQYAFEQLIYTVLKNRRLVQQDSRTALEYAREYLERNYHENITIDQLARIAEISPKYFVDVFKKTYGHSAMDYLTALRMNRAKQLMARSSAKLRDIAHQIGYQDEFYFSRKFKKEVGVTPTLYMKKRRRKIAVYQAAVMGLLLPLKILPYAAPLHPKWTSYYYQTLRSDIPVHLSAYRQGEHSHTDNLEALRQHPPELILSLDDISDDEKRELEQIASVYYIPSRDTSWRKQLELVAEWLGETAEAAAWLRSYDHKVRLAKERLQPIVQDDSFLAIRMLKNQLFVYRNQNITEIFYGDLQMREAGISPGQMDCDVPLTVEELAQMDVDRLLLLVCQETETLQYWKELQLTVPWQELKAVKNKSTYLISSDPWRMYAADAIDRVVDASVAMLSGDCP
jgi:AraC-like DNA-binding protein/ABC-type Fe3+-citrate transport system substrate-binding protein